jgi:hypothetical protein
MDMTLDEFVQEETARLALFAAYWRKNAERLERTPDGEVIWPMDLEPGEWDMQYMGFDVLDAANDGIYAVETPQGFVVRIEPDGGSSDAANS